MSEVKPTIESLIDRLTKATGPDREVDAAICIFSGRFVRYRESMSGHGCLFGIEDISTRTRHAFTAPWWGFDAAHKNPDNLGDILSVFGADVPSYTESIDAAMSLMPPKVWLDIRTGTQEAAPSPQFSWPVIVIGDQITGKEIWRGQAATLPNTLCIAALHAIVFRSTKGGGQ